MWKLILNRYFLPSFSKMPLSETVSRLSDRSEEMSRILSTISNQLDEIKEKVFIQQEKKLISENKRLNEEIEIWKSKLIEIEIKHGIKQAPLSSSKSLDNEMASITKLQTVPSVEPTPKSVEPTSKSVDNKQEKTDTPKKMEKKPKSKKEMPSEDDGKPVDVGRLDFRIGFIQSAKKHPDADSLYVEQIDVGEEKLRTVVSGLVKHIPLIEMQMRYVVLLCNLKPAKMRGILSEAMLMCASSPEKVEILEPPLGCLVGERVTFAGYSTEPDIQLNPKKKIFEQVAPDLKTDENCVATYKGVPFTIKDKGIITAATMANANIK